MTTDFLIDGMLSGTGIRDAIAGGYVAPDVVGISAQLAADITAWQKQYEEVHFAGFDTVAVAALDEAGLILTSRAQVELVDKKIGYFSNGRLERLS